MSAASRGAAPHASQGQHVCDDGSRHATEAEQERDLLAAPRPGAPEELPRLRGCRPAALAAAGAAALLAAAFFAAVGRGGLGYGGHPGAAATSLALGRRLLNLDVHLSSLAYTDFESHPEAKVAVADAVKRAFVGKIPQCQVGVDILHHLQGGSTASSSTEVQVTLVPTGSLTADDLASIVLEETDQEALRLLIAEEVNAAQAARKLAHGSVSVSAIEERAQDGELEFTAQDVAAGATVVPMDSTMLDAGRFVTIKENHHGGNQDNVTIVSKSGGDLHVLPALVHAFPMGSRVILITPDAEPATQGQAAPAAESETFAQGGQAGGGQAPGKEAGDAQDAAEPKAEVEPKLIDQVQDEGKVVETIQLMHLPADKLDGNMKGQVEQAVQGAYVQVLGKSSDQVKVQGTSAQERRLFDGSSETDVQVSVDTSEGQSSQGLASEMDAKRDALDDAIKSNVEGLPGMDDILSDPSLSGPKAGSASAKQAEGVKPPVALYLLGLVVALCCLAACVAFACMYRKKESAEEGQAQAAFLDPEQGPNARGPLALAPARAQPAQAAVPPVNLVAARDDARREELIREAFAKFDQDNDSLLNREELLRFARVCCEFTGTEEEWAKEYKAVSGVLSFNEGSGMSVDTFRRLVNNPQLGLSPRTLADPEAVSAMYCSDDDLARALLPPLERPH